MNARAPVSEARRAALLQYLLEVRDRLGLQAWDLQVSIDSEADEASQLEIVTHEARWAALVKVGAYFEADKASAQPLAEEQRQCVVHELLHLTHAHTEWWLEDGPWVQIGMHLPYDARDATEREIHRALEVVVDFAARLIARQMPLPPAWPE